MTRSTTYERCRARLISQQAREVAARCADAYSADNYNSWRAVAHLLLSNGFDEAETEEVMRSKWTRWAGDAWEGGRASKLPAKALLPHLETIRRDFRMGKLSAANWRREVTS